MDMHICIYIYVYICKCIVPTPNSLAVTGSAPVSNRASTCTYRYFSI